jgi:hypothetical protein
MALPMRVALSTITDLEVLLEAMCNGAPQPPFDYGALSSYEALPVVARFLKRPMQMDRVELIEGVFKRFLKAAFRPGLGGAEARFVAELSRTIGFVYKFKPYGVKCATALGYAIFFLWDGMGFSFQRHRTRKTELFHMLKTLDRGQIYLSTSREWDAVYERDAFDRWLSGTPDARYAAYARRPEPGDVYLVTELDTVHSVLGCVLEEYATVSTDMVDRLHDQNTRGEVPIVASATLDQWLAELPCPVPGSCWKSLSAPPVTLPARVQDGVRHIVLADTSEFLAERFDIESGRTLTIAADAERARSLFCLGGDCRVMLRDSSESGDVAPLRLAAGQVILIGPGVRIGVQAAVATSLSSHTIRPELALD